MNRDSWGMRFNHYPAHRRFSKLEKLPDCPDWFGDSQFNTWQEEGLIVWNNIDKKIEALNGSYSLRLLDQLESQDNWKTEGISVTELVSEISFELPSRGRRKKTEQKPATETNKSKTYYKEMVHTMADEAHIFKLKFPYPVDPQKRPLAGRSFLHFSGSDVVSVWKPNSTAVHLRISCAQSSALFSTAWLSAASIC